jgi:hypothetical protein
MYLTATGEHMVFGHQCILSFLPLWMQLNAVNRTNHLALWLIMVTDAFGTGVGVDDINRLTHKNGIIRTLRFADVAIDTFIGDA